MWASNLGGISVGSSQSVVSPPGCAKGVPPPWLREPWFIINRICLVIPWCDIKSDVIFGLLFVFRASVLCLPACVYFVDRDAIHTLCHRGNSSSVIPPPWSGGTADYYGSPIQQSLVGSSQSVGSPPACTKSVSVGTSNLTWGVYGPHPKQTTT